jgi:hypothetical protein
MPGEMSDLLRRIRERAGVVKSFIAHFKSSSRLASISAQSSGRVFFKAPDKIRSEMEAGGQHIVTVRRGAEVQRYLPERKEIWTCGLEDVRMPEFLRITEFGIRDPFSFLEESTSHCKGQAVRDGRAVYCFEAEARKWGSKTHLDTREGLRIPIRQKVPALHVELFIDSETGLLQRIVGSMRGPEISFESVYTIETINAPLDESLFSLDMADPEVMLIDFSDIFRAAMDPDAADNASSLN